MISIEVLREFLGWCALLNIAMMILASIAVVCFRGPIIRVHQKMFDLDDRDLSRAYFQYLAQYKIATLVLCVVPYLTLVLMSWQRSGSAL